MVKRGRKEVQEVIQKVFKQNTVTLAEQNADTQGTHAQHERSRGVLCKQSYMGGKSFGLAIQILVFVFRSHKHRFLYSFTLL